MTGGGQSADGRSQAASPRAGLVVTGHGAARGAHGVEPVVLCPPAALEGTNLDDVLAGPGQRIGQPGGEAASSFQRPDPAAGRMLAGPVQHPAVSGAVRRCREVSARSCRWRYPAPPGRWCPGQDHLR